MPQIIEQTGGAIHGFQTTLATQTNIMSLFTYEQRLTDNKLSIEFGRTNVYNYFLLTNSLDPLSYYSTTFQVDGDFSLGPYPLWGIRASYKLASTWFTQGVAFEDNFRYAAGYVDRLGTKLSSGTQLLTELGQRRAFENAADPSDLEGGMGWNTRTGRTNLKGTSAPAIPLLQTANDPSGGVIFLQGEKVIWRGARREVGSRRNVRLYGSFDSSMDKLQPIDLDTMIGLNLTGFIPERPFDVLEFQTRCQRLSQIEANAETFRHRLLA